jgi:hypothetical protein
MLDLTEIEFFSRLAPDALARVRAVTEDRAVATGTVICRRGDEGRAFHVVASGGLVVETAAASIGNAGRVYLGPGEILGEMSILSGLPVSATVIAVQPTRLFRISRESFLELLQNEPALQLALSQLLIRRIRQRTGATREGRQGVVVLDGAWHSEPAQDLARALHRGVSHYAPGSSVAAGSTAETDKAMEEWREGPGAGRYLLLVSDSSSPARWDHRLERGDAILTLAVPRLGDAGENPQGTPMGLADRAVVEFEWEAARNSTTREEWSFTVPPSEVKSALDTPTWSRRTVPALDRLVRWVARREIGFALGAGAALGFAHLGVLEVLEDAGVPIDCLAGSSMGGIVALAYAREGNARAAI